jgi:hypothetical protein
MEIPMRLLLAICVVTVSLAAGGCDRPDSTASAPGNALATPSTAESPGNAGAVPDATARSAGTAAANPPAPVAPVAAAPAWREVTIPAGTNLPVVLDTGVGSDTSRVEQAVTAHLARAIRVGGEVVVPEGSRVGGVVTQATRSGKVKGLAHVTVRFNSLTPRGDDQRYEISTAAIARTAAATKKQDALKVGAPAAGGALIGAIVGGRKGALIGTAAGGGAGTAVVMSTRGKEVRLARGAALTLRLTEPLTVRIRG